MLEVLGTIFLFLIFGIVLLAGLAIPIMDMLTYGNPPGLFKNKTWQTIRKLWTK